MLATPAKLHQINDSIVGQNERKREGEEETRVLRKKKKSYEQWGDHHASYSLCTACFYFPFTSCFPLILKLKQSIEFANHHHQRREILFCDKRQRTMNIAETQLPSKLIYVCRVYNKPKQISAKNAFEQAGH